MKSLRIIVPCALMIVCGLVDLSHSHATSNMGEEVAKLVSSNTDGGVNVNKAVISDVHQGHKKDLSSKLLEDFDVDNNLKGAQTTKGFKTLAGNAEKLSPTLHEALEAFSKNPENLTSTLKEVLGELPSPLKEALGALSKNPENLSSTLEEVLGELPPPLKEALGALSKNPENLSSTLEEVLGKLPSTVKEELVAFSKNPETLFSTLEEALQASSKNPEFSFAKLLEHIDHQSGQKSLEDIQSMAGHVLTHMEDEHPEFFHKIMESMVPKEADIDHKALWKGMAQSGTSVPAN